MADKARGALRYHEGCRERHQGGPTAHDANARDEHAKARPQLTLEGARQTRGQFCAMHVFGESVILADDQEGRCQSNSDAFGGNVDHPISNFD